MFHLQNGWELLLQQQLQAPYFQSLTNFLKEEYETNTIFPHKNEVFQALHYTSFQETKVVILGQDPYHGHGQAHGLSFSVKPEMKIPPSLKNIYKELQTDLGYSIPQHGFLEHWALQGVLLLNTVLTVREGEPNAHNGKGWEKFTDEVISLLNNREKPVIFVLWGKNAEKKKVLITGTQHKVIQSPHPSPLSASRGFFGSRPFSKVNQYLLTFKEREIDWELPT